MDHSTNKRDSVLDKRIDAVDQIRGIAALIVVIYHARAVFWEGVAAEWNENGLSADFIGWIGYSTAPFSLGWFGVHLFFVVSGYCIHRSASREYAKGGGVNWGRFFWRRFWRIYPVYVCAFFATIAVDVWSGALNIEYFFSPSGAYDVLLSLLTLQGLFGDVIGSNVIFWTLTIEIHIYLFYPIIFYMRRVLGNFYTCLLLFLLSFSYILFDIYFGVSAALPPVAGPTAVFLPFLFMWYCGAAVGELESTDLDRLLNNGVVAISFSIIGIIGILLVESGSSHLFLLACMPLSFGAVYIFMLMRTLLEALSGGFPLIGHVLKSIGERSYSLYATHIVSFGLVLNITEFEKSDNILYTFLFVIASLIFSFVFYVVVERPSIMLSQSYPVRARN